jgi:hypothetical protein
MSNARHPSLAHGLDGRLNGDGNSASGDEQHSSSSAIGANFSIHGPILCRCFHYRGWVSVQCKCKGRLISLLQVFFAVEILSGGLWILS